MSLLKSVLLFLTNQTAQFISHGISRCYFHGNFLLSFLLWYDFKILVKSRGGGTFLCLASSVNVRPNYFFFHLRAKYPVFIFLIWMEQFWFSRKLTKNIKIFIVFKSFPYCTPCVWLSNLGSDLSIDNIVQLGLDNTKNQQPRCCHEGARTHKKVKIGKC